MEVGIFAKTCVRPSLAATLDAVTAHGLRCVQFNLSCAGLPTLPAELDPAVAAGIGAALRDRGIAMAAVSGTFNMIHPDLAVRRDGLRRLAVLAQACPYLGTNLITLCTGTRDPDNMWRRHPDNDGPDAWRDLLSSLEMALRTTEASGVLLAVEPEVSNVVDSARKARRLLDELADPRLKVIMDGANLFHAGELAVMHDILDEAFDLLGPDLVLAHAKDLRTDGAAGDCAAGTGVLDYPHYLSGLRRAGYAGPWILHGLTEQEVPASVAFLRALLAEAA